MGGVSIASAVRLHLAGDLDGAARAYRALGDNADALCNLGLIAKAHGQLAEAEALLKRAMELDPAAPFPAYNLGSLYLRSGRPDEAVEPLRIAAAHPRMTGARLNLGNVYLALGRDAEGWRLYDERAERLNSQVRKLSFPEWQGEPLGGKRLFVWPEQGFGDLILAARYLPLTGAAQVTLVTPPELARLFQQLPVEIVERRGDLVVTPHDYWTLPLSLPRWLSPVPTPYIVGSARSSGGIGVAWKGNALPDPGRSLPVDLSGELLSLPGAISLHPEDSGARDFQDTADIIAGLDLVISVDTFVAHLAGAMGKPTILLLQRQSADWRWRETRPWYPSVEIVRPSTQGDWKSAVAAARKLASCELSAAR
jgi:Glycosyltransferase family 9 (heptosyltransferase)/Tetratricopeptide repeat